jgi:glucose/mannose transport system permease protein
MRGDGRFSLVKLRWSRVTPYLALTPALAVTLVCFLGAIVWTVALSLTASRRFPDYTFTGFAQYARLLGDRSWSVSLVNVAILGAGSLASIILGFILAALVDKEARGEALFRTVFLYPLAVSMIVTGLVWRWLFNPALGVQHVLDDLGWTALRFDWLAHRETAIYGVILASVWQSTGFYMAMMLAGLKAINPEIWKAAKLDGVPVVRLYVEIIIPMMKFTVLTCLILLSLGVVKAYDVVVAMTNGGPGNASYVPAYFTISAYWQNQNLGYASAAATLMLAMTAVLFLPFIAYSAIRRGGA